jgi:hypothetical protein
LDLLSDNDEIYKLYERIPTASDDAERKVLAEAGIDISTLPSTKMTRAEKAELAKKGYDAASSIKYSVPSNTEKLRAAELQASHNCGTKLTSIIYVNSMGEEETFESVCVDGRKYKIKCNFSGGSLNNSGQTPKLDKQMEVGGPVIGSVNACWAS